MSDDLSNGTTATSHPDETDRLNALVVFQSLDDYPTHRGSRSTLHQWTMNQYSLARWWDRFDRWEALSQFKEVRRGNQTVLDAIVALEANKPATLT